MPRCRRGIGKTDRSDQAIAAFLAGLAQETQLRGYNFDHSKIARRRLRTQIDETRGQLIFEWGHLRAKLRRRAPSSYRELLKITLPEPHPLFRIVPGDVRDWEKR